jgi:hypothetical protein
MPDLDGLPRHPRPPVFAPRTGDFAAVVAKAKHRRRTHLGASGAGLAGLVAVFALAVSHGAGTYGLQPAPPAAVVGTSRHGQASATPAAPDTAVVDGTASRPGGRTGGGITGTTAGGTVATPAPGGGTAPRGQVPRPVVVRDDVLKPFGDLCDTDPSSITATGWCLWFDEPGYVKTGGDAAFVIMACRYQGTGAKTLKYFTDQQIDFEIDSDSNGSHQVWKWSHGYTFPKHETTVTVGDGRCARWTVHWNTTGNDGVRLKPGQYWLAPSLLPYDWGGMSIGYDAGMYGIEVTAH